MKQKCRMNSLVDWCWIFSFGNTLALGMIEKLNLWTWNERSLEFGHSVSPPIGEGYCVQLNEFQGRQLLYSTTLLRKRMFISISFSLCCMISEWNKYKPFTEMNILPSGPCDSIIQNEAQCGRRRLYQKPPMNPSNLPINHTFSDHDKRRWLSLCVNLREYILMKRLHPLNHFIYNTLTII